MSQRKLLKVNWYILMRKIHFYAPVMTESIKICPSLSIFHSSHFRIYSLCNQLFAPIFNGSFSNLVYLLWSFDGDLINFDKIIAFWIVGSFLNDRVRSWCDQVLSQFFVNLFQTLYTCCWHRGNVHVAKLSYFGQLFDFRVGSLCNQPPLQFQLILFKLWSQLGWGVGGRGIMKMCMWLF